VYKRRKPLCSRKALDLHKDEQEHKHSESAILRHQSWTVKQKLHLSEDILAEMCAGTLEVIESQNHRIIKCIMGWVGRDL